MEFGFWSAVELWLEVQQRDVESAISLPYVRILSDTHSHANTGQIGIVYDYSRKLVTPYPDLEPGDKLWNQLGVSG